MLPNYFSNHKINPQNFQIKIALFKSLQLALLLTMQLQFLDINDIILQKSDFKGHISKAKTWFQPHLHFVCFLFLLLCVHGCCWLQKKKYIFPALSGRLLSKREPTENLFKDCINVSNRCQIDFLCITCTMKPGTLMQLLSPLMIQNLHQNT